MKDMQERLFEKSYEHFESLCFYAAFILDLPVCKYRKR